MCSFTPLANSANMKQDYSKYTNTDQEIWKTLFDRQIKILEGKASKTFFDALATIQFNAEKIPYFEDINKILIRETGWKLEVVPEFIEASGFFEFLSEKKFPATSWIRNWDQLDYIVEPDMFHDVFGHVPLFVNKTYCEFANGMAKLGTKYQTDEHSITMLQRIYWFTIEFGLIKETNKIKIYGAGILSSPEEADYSLSDLPNHLSYSAKEIFNSPFKINEKQPKYFIIDSFQQLVDSLPEIDSLLQQGYGKPKKAS